MTLKLLQLRPILASIVGFLIFYSVFWGCMGLCGITSQPNGIRSLFISITMVSIGGLLELPLALVTGLPLFLLTLFICDRLTRRIFLNVACHALLAVPLGGLFMAAVVWGGPGIVENGHEIVRLALVWHNVSLVSGAMGGVTSWMLRPKSSRGGR